MDHLIWSKQFVNKSYYAGYDPAVGHYTALLVVVIGVETLMVFTRLITIISDEVILHTKSTSSKAFVMTALLSKGTRTSAVTVDEAQLVDNF